MLKHVLVLWIGLWLPVACTSAAQPLAGGAGAAAPAEPPRNVILFVSDGAGPASFTLARDYLRDVLGGTELALDSILVGAAKTYSTSSRVTDSAAGATAFSSGVKTYNGAIAVDTLERPVATLLEAAEAAGMATGLVATSRITHATPASFAAHVPSRSMENEIASQMLTHGVDVIFGGGRRHFLPEARDGRRDDGRDLLAEAEAAGTQVVLTRGDFEQPLRTPVLGLFSMDHMAYEIDRDALREPSLAEMTRAALDLLEDDPDGFFLLVEGSRIDHAGHANDPAAHLHDLLAYDEAAAAALDFARRDGETLLVAVSDHETGGLTLGRSLDGAGIYRWEPRALESVRSSIGPIVGEMLTLESRTPADVLRETTGIDDLTEAEAALLEAALTDAARLEFTISELISRRALIGWTTTGHTAVDVNLFAYGPGWQRFVGTHDNTFVGEALADLLGFDLAARTEVLRNTFGTR